MKDSANIIFLALTIWREASGETVGVKEGVGCVIRNRVTHPGWWGKTWMEVVFKKWQFSAMTAPGDPNLTRWPKEKAQDWIDCLEVAEDVYRNLTLDPTGGATYYHDQSITKPETWGESIQPTVKIGKIQFYRG
ncbi:MAG: cell wall hydrolase [bacterium]